MNDGFSDAGFVKNPGISSETLIPAATRALRDFGRQPDGMAGLFADPPDIDDNAAMATLIRLAMPKNEEPALLAQALLGRFGSFSATLAASPQALRSVAGVGPYLLSALAVFRETGVRLRRAELTDCEILSDRKTLYAYLSAVLSREVIEQFHILFLAENGRLIADEAQARGTVNHTPVYPREVVKRALELKAHALVLVHNHPSGDPTPSPDDLTMTKNVASAAAILGIEVKDHVIVGNGQWLSFAEKELL